jgi:hemerythrin-like metal-binding protein
MASNWGPHLRTGISEIDAQHEELFRVASTMSERLAVVGEVDSTAETLEWLTEFALRHFELEERWMRQNRFRLLREHVEKHDRFLAQLAAMINDLRDNGASAVLKLRLRNALASLEAHVEDDDRGFAKHKAASHQTGAYASC